MSKDYQEVYAYLDDLEVKAYNRGYSDGTRHGMEISKDYECGLNDAWDAAQKISQYKWDLHMINECFPENRGQSYALIFGSNTAREAIDKIKKYEEKRKQSDEEITIGDEVTYCGGGIYNGQKGVVIGTTDDWAEVRFVSSWNCIGVLKDSLEKAHRHFPEIAKILESMKGEQA